MRIHSIANSPNFGYNKELNEKVNKKLKRAKGNRELADTMLALNTYCMETEDKLRKAEESKNWSLVERYECLLIGIKTISTNFINSRFPELKYRKKEIETYQNEVIQRKLNRKPEHWLNQIIYSMDFSDEVDDILEDATAIAKKATKEGKSHEETLDAVNSTLLGNGFKLDDKKKTNKIDPPKETKKPDKTESKSKVDGAELVDLFVTGEYSPKGFVSIGGMESLKENITDKIILPLRDPEGAKLDEVEYGKKMPRGELLYGPPGCGKTYFAEALAQETGLPMYKLKVSKVGSTFVNGSANNLEAAYSYVKEVVTRTGKPVIMFMDEIETFAPKRDESGKRSEGNKLLSTFLQIMDEARNDNVFVVGATNLINLIDPAVASRFDNKDYIEVPKDDTRRIVLQMMLMRFTKGQNLANDSEALEDVVRRTSGFSNRTLGVLVQEAADIARKDGRRPLLASDFEEPVKKHMADKITNESIYRDKASTPSIGYRSVR